MSADNYYVIRKHPAGGYAAIHAFASDETPLREVDIRRDPPFTTIDAAVEWTLDDYTEYGTVVHDECK